MNIIVCIKRVAATTTAIKVAGDGTSLDTNGVEFELNPYDEFAVEQAIQTRDQAGSGSVTVVTLGDKSTDGRNRAATLSSTPRTRSGTAEGPRGVGVLYPAGRDGAGQPRAGRRAGTRPG